MLLWAFEISENPKSPINVMGVKDGALAHPQPFSVLFKPRIDNLRGKLSAYHGD